MSTLKVNNIGNTAGTKQEATEVLVDKKFGSWETQGSANGTVFQASTDLFVHVWTDGSGSGRTSFVCVTGSSNPPTNVVGRFSVNADGNPEGGGECLQSEKEIIGALPMILKMVLFFIEYCHLEFNNKRSNHEYNSM